MSDDRNNSRPRSILLARVDGWKASPPIYTAPEGRTIAGLRSVTAENIVEVTLDNGEVVRIECGAPRFATVH